MANIQPASALGPEDSFTPEGTAALSERRRLASNRPSEITPNLELPKKSGATDHKNTAAEKRPPPFPELDQASAVQPFSKVCKIVGGANSIILSGEYESWQKTPLTSMLRSKKPVLHFDSLDPDATSHCLNRLFHQYPDSLSLVADSLKKCDVVVKFDAGRKIQQKFTQHMNALSYVCLKVGRVHGDKVFEHLASKDPIAVGSSLLVRASDLFTLPRIASILRPLIFQCNDPALSHIEKVEFRTRTADVTSGLIAAYLEHHAGRRSSSEIKPPSPVQNTGEASLGESEANLHLSKEMRNLLSLADAEIAGITKDLDDLTELVFQHPSLPLTLETYTELVGYFFAGGLRYARFAFDKSTSERDHTAIALAFGFSMIGSIPAASPFTGFSAVVTDATLKHFWKPKDATGFIEHLAANFLATVSAGIMDKDISAVFSFRVHFEDTFNAAKNLKFGHPKSGLLRRGLGFSKEV